MVKTIVKAVILMLITAQLLFIETSCIQREDIPYLKEYNVIGRLVNSCDDPTPVRDKLEILETPRFFKFFCDVGYKLVAKAYTDETVILSLPTTGKIA